MYVLHSHHDLHMIEKTKFCKDKLGYYLNLFSTEMDRIPMTSSPETQEYQESE